MKEVKVLPYNAKWPKMYENEATFIKQVLGKHCIAIHHIGSTSVPGLSAKEDLDVLCVIDNLPSSLLLESQGFIFKGELNIPLRYYFSKNTTTSKVNLHVVEADHAFIALNLGFRDYLRAHDEARIAYARLKEELMSDPENFKKVSGIFSGYGLGKDAFIKNILRTTGFNELMLNLCVHHQEWADYHRIHKEIFAHMNVKCDRTHLPLTSDDHYHLVLYKGTTIITVAHVEFLPNNREVIMHSLATDSRFHKQGFGTHMLMLLERWIKVREYHRITAHIPVGAEAFFRKRGYEDKHRLDGDTREGYVILAKIL